MVSWSAVMLNAHILILLRHMPVSSTTCLVIIRRREININQNYFQYNTLDCLDKNCNYYQLFLSQGSCFLAVCCSPVTACSVWRSQETRANQYLGWWLSPGEDIMAWWKLLPGRTIHLLGHHERLHPSILPQHYLKKNQNLPPFYFLLLLLCPFCHKFDNLQIFKKWGNL